MKKFSKLFLAIALVVCLTASAVACAKNNDDKSDDTKENDPAVTTEASGNPENPENTDNSDNKTPDDSGSGRLSPEERNTEGGYGELISRRTK